MAEANAQAGIIDDELFPQQPEGVQNAMSNLQYHRWANNIVYYRLDNAFSRFSYNLYLYRFVENLVQYG